IQQLNQYARNKIKKRLETIDGVGQVRLGGERERTIRVNLDTTKMAAFGITVPDLVRVFNTEHLRLPGGFLVSNDREELIELDLEYHSARALGRMIISYSEGAPTRLEDIAEIEDGLADFRQLARFNAETTIGIGIVKVQNANTVAIVDEVQRRLDEELIPQLPPGMTLRIAHNDGDLIRGIIEALEQHLIEGILLTALVVWLFLKSFRSTIIIAVAIPVSLLGAIAVMYFMGYTFNTMTMLGLLLLIGVVVDDAIVVLENIFRHREEIDPDPVSAALNGTKQVVFAVMAATFTLVAIFAPVIFMQGVIGRFFQAFAVVVTFGVLVSLFVSLTLTPMLCARHLKVAKRHGWLYRFFERGFTAMDSFYKTLLEGALRFRWTVVILTILTVYFSGYFFSHIGKGFMPVQDEGRFLVSFKTPLGSSIDYATERMKSIEKILSGHSEVEGYFATIGTDQSRQVSKGSFIVRMIPWEERSLSQIELIELLRTEMAEIPGVLAFPTPMPAVGGQRGEPLQFILGGPDLNEVARLARQLKEKLKAYPALGDVDMGLELDLPQLELKLSRERVRSLGLSTQDVALAVNVMAGGMDIARFNDDSGDNERYNIRLKAGEGQLQNAQDLSRIYLRAKDGEMVRLDNLVILEPRLGAAVVSRHDLQYAANFYSTPTVSLGEAVDMVNEAAEGILPIGYQVNMIGRAEEFAKTATNMMFAFVTSLLLVYMVLASQFNSFIQPLIIMVAQPLAIIGGVAALWLTGNTLNIYSMIGLVLLVGLVAKNSILLVDLTNQVRSEGKGINEALREACPVRLRPVLMTSLTIILALTPAALGFGAGSDTNGPLAIAVIGGMVSSTLLTLVVVPSVYSLVENGIVHAEQKRNARKEGAASI
ncbi:MAG: efflux RND transporter permease subunit, partial [Pseudomonadota bacterium]|nr:efflux RND transporter permease subunit [Pseudomonadota bacterium]